MAGIENVTVDPAAAKVFYDKAPHRRRVVRPRAGAHRIAIGGAGTFTDQDGFVWEGEPA